MSKNKKSRYRSISEVYFGYNTTLEVYLNLSSDINVLSEMPKPAFGKEGFINSFKIINLEVKL